MNKQVDARGLACPSPVILTKKELDNLNEGTVTTIVDNQVAKENVSKLVSSMGLEYTVENSENDYIIKIVKGEGYAEQEEVSLEVLNATTIAIGTDKMGLGSDELGNILMKSFIFTVKETEPHPDHILFYNSGVYLTCEGSQVLDDLKDLADSGVEILSCGTCLDYYNLKEKLGVGSISNMYSIYETMRKSNTININ